MKVIRSIVEGDRSALKKLGTELADEYFLHTGEWYEGTLEGWIYSKLYISYEGNDSLVAILSRIIDRSHAAKKSTLIQEFT